MSNDGGAVSTMGVIRANGDVFCVFYVTVSLLQNSLCSFVLISISNSCLLSGLVIHMSGCVTAPEGTNQRITI